ncbi:MAG: hypothetical protein CMJ80_07700 [Planctomycetaceae bacterium]|nr:hypothetical protein [Planctomycetaceae bacterium]
MNARREKIEEMLVEEPNDVFLRYSLATELYKDGETDKCFGMLQDLMKEQPPYVPAFFMAGQRYAESRRLDEARQSLRDGIDQARQQGDLHAAGEMSEFLASIGPE